MKCCLFQAKRCAEEFAKAVRLEFIDRYVGITHLHLNIKTLILVTTSIHFFPCKSENSMVHQYMQRNIAKNVASSAIKEMVNMMLIW